ncbi:MAG: RNA polymerase sigma factor [Dehalococcoidales bacterium]|nr:RNA polymerase sigma factor [Dehalococcoidales bacterium]
MMDAEQEKALIEQAKSDTAAFGQLYDCYYSRIFGYILKRTASIEASKDITSEVFIKALTNIHRFKWRDTPFSAWLYRIANNEISNHYRKNGTHHHDIETIKNSMEHSGPSPETELINAEEELKTYTDFLLVQKAIRQLPTRYQEVLTLRFFEKKKFSEIAEITGKREGTVKSLVHRGLEKLRVMMETDTEQS